MARRRPLFVFRPACAFLAILLAAAARARVVEHTFNVGKTAIGRLCQERTIIAVNGQFPGPTILLHEGDTVVVRVINRSPYNMTIHWHGIFQRLSGWADGPCYITQCPIAPGGRYTYRFAVVGQEGTLWWHAHASTLRATVYGALVVYPRAGAEGYPFPEPYGEAPVLLGEWWNSNVVDVEGQALATGGAPNVSDAFTINGRPGDLYPCSRENTYGLTVVPGKTYLLRIVNAALNNQLFFKVAGHSLTVVAVDAGYTTPYPTDVVAIAPGQTVDALLDADAVAGSYYMAARAYFTVPHLPFDNTTTTGILRYAAEPASSQPSTAALPAFDDTATAHRFYTDLTGLLRRGTPRVPLAVDEAMFVTIGMGLVPCDQAPACAGPFGQKLAAGMNNVSFRFPTDLSLLQAHFFGVAGVYTPDFPDTPEAAFDYTSPGASLDQTLLRTVKATRVKRVGYNATVEIVLQGTSLLGVENHPIHLHGFDFFVLAQGFGNYDAAAAEESFNLVNPQVRNTIAVPVGGWAVIRFVANNPGVWIMHCHLDSHLTMGLAMAFVVENGPAASSTLPPPPSDLPSC